MEDRWFDIRQGILDDYFLFCRDMSWPEIWIPAAGLPCGIDAGLVLMSGVPVIMVRDGDEGSPEVIGDAMGADDMDVLRLVEESFPRFGGRDGCSPSDVIGVFLDDWDSVGASLQRKMRERTGVFFPEEAFRRLVLMDAVTGESSVDRATFYMATRFMDENALSGMRHDLGAEVKDIFLSGVSPADLVSLRHARGNIAASEETLDALFDSSYRLGGLLDLKLANRAAFYGSVLGDDIVRVAKSVMSSPGFNGRRADVLYWAEHQSKEWSVMSGRLKSLLAPIWSRLPAAGVRGPRL